MSSCICLRCGHRWYVRGNFRYANLQMFAPKRCASCRSPYWNKPYQRDMSKSGRLNPQSAFKISDLPLYQIATSHSGSKVRSKQLEIPADKYVHVKGAKIASPGTVRSSKSPALFKSTARHLACEICSHRWLELNSRRKKCTNCGSVFIKKISRPVKSRAVRASVKRGKIKTSKNKCK